MHTEQCRARKCVSKTRHEYEQTMFYQWANEALNGAKQVVVN